MCSSHAGSWHRASEEKLDLDLRDRVLTDKQAKLNALSHGMEPVLHRQWFFIKMD